MEKEIYVLIEGDEKYKHIIFHIPQQACMNTMQELQTSIIKLLFLASEGRFDAQTEEMTWKKYIQKEELTPSILKKAVSNPALFYNQAPVIAVLLNDLHTYTYDQNQNKHLSLKAKCSIFSLTDGKEIAENAVLAKETALFICLSV